jgi:PAS domain S-box-containing protein
MAALEDITDQRRARERLELLGAAVDSAASSIVVTDRAGTIKWVNRAFTATTGYAPDEAVGRTPGELIGSGKQHAGFYRDFWDTILAGDVWRGRLLNRRKDGTLYPEEQVVTPVRDEAGRITHFIAVKVDVGQREEASRRIRFQSTLLDAVGQAVIAMDLAGRVTYWNRSAEALYGWTAEEAMGTDAVELTAATGARDEAIEILERLRRREPWSGEFHLRRKDGSTFFGLVTYTPILDEDGVLTGIVGASTDLTERREIEASLRQSQKMEAVGRLAAGVAHDFNNLLTVIQGHTQMVLDDLPGDSRLRDDLGEILGEADRAARLTRQLLAFSRRQVRAERVLDLGRTLVELEPLLRRLVPSRVTLHFEPGEGGVLVRADPSQIEQVVLNLAVNAGDAIESEGSVHFRVGEEVLTAEQIAHAGWSVAPGAYAILTVEDTGHGMTPEVMERMFEPFFTTKPEGRGTGLGLSTVFGIVQQSGGVVDGDSEPGKGTTFRVLLPRAHEAAAEGSREEPSPGEQGAGPAAGGAATILLVDDTDAVLRVGRRILERAGYRVLTAADGREALALIGERGGEIDLVVSDVVMPDMGGTALLAELLERGTDLGFVLSSGHPDDEIPLEARHRAAAFLPKPYRAADLIRVVREALETS